MITLRIESAAFERSMRGLLQTSKRPRSLLQAAARSVRRAVIRHFRARDKQGNTLGGRRTHWWARVARSTHLGSVTDRQAIISISEPGIGLKVYGGTVTPKVARALTIPIHPEAYGRRAGTIEAMTGMQVWRFTPRKGGPTFLARSLGDDTIRLLYVLKRSATHRPDPNALPPAAAMAGAAISAAKAQLQSEINRRKLS